MPDHLLTQLDALPPTPCPCGSARRAFATPGETVASVHLVDIREDARPHYHRRMTEIYVVLEGEGELELDGQRVPVRPLTAVYLKPGCHHRAIGKLRILNLVIPAFDPADECVDAPDSPVGRGPREEESPALGPNPVDAGVATVNLRPSKSDP